MADWVRERIIIGRDNAPVEQFLENGAPLAASKITAITRTQLVAVDTNAVLVDSASTSGALVWDSAASTLTLNLGAAGVSPGVYRVRVVIFTATATDGLELIDEDSDTILELEFVNRS